MSKAYRKMKKYYKKLILRDAKSASIDPFDYSFGLQVFVDHLYFMRDYYRLGENVYGAESEDGPSREQCLNMILAEYEEWQNCDEKYTKVIFKGEKDAEDQLNDLMSKGYHLKEEKDNMFKDVYFLYKYEDYHENTQKMCEEYAFHRKRFFELLDLYLQHLWD